MIMFNVGIIDGWYNEFQMPILNGVVFVQASNVVVFLTAVVLLLS